MVGRSLASICVASFPDSKRVLALHGHTMIRHDMCILARGVHALETPLHVDTIRGPYSRGVALHNVAGALCFYWQALMNGCI